ncbi:TetR/AcrR family transcriptional regulator [Myceligenerans pegani]|uniref:TetR/AcrR family transcriptional regulator n=1 Tax=Myceligenerans pegani TaxID=2776917 RepID=A0ABR9N5R9_9MICO|nr:TetR/AcrR family transcriptional regulator [Myceligenerans sp. TRM 65318]MBE1879015.1 TetR/AcrR family transcriptional regulator [Myceligenerans sp. TRM 65318]MBE3021286.1 TetR/AcrR family transcriptional regulator [Myceligenerans sp. TRM 65318]
MARWEPNARERLVRAAIDLFSEQGYDNTTVIEIAERAGLTKTTFFRHFPNKREVLSTGQEELGQLLREGIAGAPTSTTPLEAVAAGLDAATARFTPAQREFGPRLEAVIAANSDLQERDAFKHTRLVAAMAEALEERGVPDPVTRIAAELGGLAFSRAFTRWTMPANTLTFSELARRTLRELHAATRGLD